MQRISSQLNNTDTQYYLRKQEVNQNKLNRQIGSQSQIGSLRDDPIAAGHLVRYQSYLGRVNQFEKNAQTGNMEMNKIEIYDNIKIVTDKASVTADKGVYLPQTGIIKLYDHVFIDQQGNKLQGDFAETNLNTGKSRIIAGKTSQGRVSGVFKQKSQK